MSRLMMMLSILGIQALMASAAHAALPEDEYKQMLQIAQLKVNRLNALRQGGGQNALSTSLARNILGRYYEAGDVWDVIACKEKSTMAAMDSNPVRYSNKCSLFHYEVLEVKPGAQTQVKVRVTQKEGYGLKLADPKIEAIDLTWSDQFAQNQKLYHFAHHGSFFASPNGVHTSATLLELYPLDVPDIYTAEQLPAPSLPVLPPELQAPAQQAGFSADLNKSVSFDQQDLFGRDIQILWQRGDLWPAYMKTPNGTAILVRK